MAAPVARSQPHVEAARRLVGNAPFDECLNLSSLLIDRGRLGETRDILKAIPRRWHGMDIRQPSGVAHRLALASGDLTLLAVVEPPDPACNADTLAFSDQIDSLGEAKIVAEPLRRFAGLLRGASSPFERRASSWVSL